MVHLGKMRMTYTLLAGAHIALVAAIPPPPEKSDPVVLDMSSYPDSVTERVYKKCDDPLVVNADQDPEKIWEGLGCHELRGALDGNFSGEWDTTSLSYVEYAASRPSEKCPYLAANTYYLFPASFPIVCMDRHQVGIVNQ